MNKGLDSASAIVNMADKTSLLSVQAEMSQYLLLYHETQKCILTLIIHQEKLFLQKDYLRLWHSGSLPNFREQKDKRATGYPK